MEDSSDNFQERAMEFARKNWVVLALFSGGVVLLLIGLIQLLGPKTSASNSSFQNEAEVAGAASESSNSAKIKIDVEGEVQNPGVYNLPLNARVQDALIAAGGLSQDADRILVEKTINLAQKLIDGQKIYVPSEQDAGGGASSGVGASLGTSGGKTASDLSINGGLVSINSASEQDLDSLPAVGPVTAQKIIDNRPYSQLDDLVAKKAVGKATFEKIKDLISL